jgi:hypothetical protein
LSPAPIWLLGGFARPATDADRFVSNDVLARRQPIGLFVCDSFERTSAVTTLIAVGTGSITRTLSPASRNPECTASAQPSIPVQPKMM